MLRNKVHFYLRARVVNVLSPDIIKYFFVWEGVVWTVF